MRFSRHAKNEMRLYGFNVGDIEGIVGADKPWGLDRKGNPIFRGHCADGRRATVVTALDRPDFVITVYGERQ